MAFVASSNSANICSLDRRNPISLNSIAYPFSVSFPLRRKSRTLAVGTVDEGDGVVRSSKEAAVYGAELLKKPVAPLPSSHDEQEPVDDDEDEKTGGEGDTWVDWEDQILEETVPLVGFVRMILFSGKYEVGDRLSPEHTTAILDRLLPYHPEYEKKIGCGVDYIVIGYHPTFQNSKCMFIKRTDGDLVDFSYWKCIKGLIRKNYPLYAESFIIRHFRHRRQRE